MKLARAALAASATLLLASCARRETDAGKTYTYRDTLSPISTWSPTDYSMSSEASIIALTSDALYEFVPNAARDGHDVVPSLADGLPEDVTGEYAGREPYGVPSGATEGWAWRVRLNRAARWDNGEPITADTYDYSLRQYLSPEMKNYRASSYYESGLPLANARDYYRGAAEYDAAHDGAEDGDLWVSLTQDVSFFGGSVEANAERIGAAAWERLQELSGGRTYFPLTPEVKDALRQAAAAAGDGSPDAYRRFCFTRSIRAATPWSSVGFVKDDDYTITFILSRSLTPFMFIFHASNPMLLRRDLYEANKVRTGDITKSRYGTSVASSASYGPYRITAWQPDRSITLERNEAWYGYSDGRHEGQYQTTGVELQFINDPDTIMNLFLQGKLDSVSIPARDVPRYGNSEFRRITPQSYTYKFSFNIDRDALRREDGGGIVHSIIANRAFRKGVSLSLDRQRWVEATSPASAPGYGLINHQYIAVPETGELYRDTPQAQQALLNHYGAATLEDITGYDLKQARECFQQAYDEEVAAGNLLPSDRVQIDMHTSTASEGIMRRVAFLQDALNAATEGTGLEGKVTVKQVTDQRYYDNMRAGNVDLAITAWGGMSMDPYGVLSCYADRQYLNEYGFDPDTESVAITLDGAPLTRTYAQWNAALNQGEFSGAPADVRNTILAACEEGLLGYYNMIPLEYMNSLTLESQRVVEYSDHYINSLVQFGGISHRTYTMDDAEWDAYCAGHNNQLQY